MMLKDSLYTIQKINVTNNTVEALTELNKEHEVFKGHFPSHPLLPGACILQMVKEILTIAVTEKLQLIKADEIKYLQMIEPVNNTVLLCSIQYESRSTSSIYAIAKFEKDNTVCCKLKALYKKI